MNAQVFPPERTTEHVPIVNDTPFVAFTVPWAVKPPRHSITVVVKGTFSLASDGAALALAAEQRPPEGDLRDGAGELGEALVYASDFAVLKPKVDVTLRGHGYPKADDRTVGLVELAIADTLSERLAIFGERRWDGLGAQSAPRPFERVPLSHTRAWGGPDDARNPVGLGRRGDLLPQLERPDALIQSRHSRVSPACFAPIAAEWPARQRHLGTYDRAWLAERWPYFPEDFDWRYFNAAPDALQLDALRGDEAFTLRGVRPDGEVLRGRLPSIAVRVFAVARASGALVEAHARLDTLHFDSDALEAVLCWRAVIEVDDIDASELAMIYVTHEVATDTPRPTEVVREALERALAEVADDDEEPSHESDDEPPSEPIPAARPVDRIAIVAALSVEGPLRGVAWAGADLSRLDLSGRDLTGADLTAANLTGADLRDAILRDAKLDRVQAAEVRFDRCDLRGADLAGATLDGAQLEDANLEGAALDGASLRGARLAGAKAAGATLVEAVAEEADFAAADLREADLSSANVVRAGFREARLDDAMFYDADGSASDFEGASATDARFDGARLEGATLSALDAPGASFEGADLRGARLSGAKLPSANLARARLAGAILDGATLRQASFRKADLEGAWLTGSDLMQADLDHANLRGADLRHTNLYQAETWGAVVDDAAFDGALLFGSKLEERSR